MNKMIVSLLAAAFLMTGTAMAASPAPAMKGGSAMKGSMKSDSMKGSMKSDSMKKGSAMKGSMKSDSMKGSMKKSDKASMKSTKPPKVK